MVFVMLGNSPYSFSRLLDIVNEWAKTTGEHVIVQAGHTPTDGVDLDCRGFIDHDEVIELIRSSDFVICQGGFGSLKDCLELGKPVIAMSRTPEYGEALHSQRELVDALVADGRVVSLDDDTDLSGAVTRVKTMSTSENKSTKLPDLISYLIDKYMDGT